MTTDQPALAYVLTIPNEREFYDDIMEEDDYHQLYRLLDKLHDRDQKVLRMRFFEHKTYDQIANHIGRTRERTRQIILHALKTLHDLMVGEYRGSVQYTSDVVVEQDGWYYPEYTWRRIAAYNQVLEKLIEFLSDRVYHHLYTELRHQLKRITDWEINTRIYLRYKYGNEYEYNPANIKAAMSTIYRIMKYWNKFYIGGSKLIIKRPRTNKTIDVYGVRYRHVDLYAYHSRIPEAIKAEKYKAFKAVYHEKFMRLCKNIINTHIDENEDRRYVICRNHLSAYRVMSTVTEITNQLT